jgi:hypothetical protein
LVEKAILPATKHTSCFVISASQQQLTAIVAANSNVDDSEYTAPQLFKLMLRPNRLFF